MDLSCSTTVSMLRTYTHTDSTPYFYLSWKMNLLLSQQISTKHETGERRRWRENRKSFRFFPSVIFFVAAACFRKVATMFQVRFSSSEKSFSVKRRHSFFNGMSLTHTDCLIKDIRKSFYRRKCSKLSCRPRFAHHIWFSPRIFGHTCRMPSNQHNANIPADTLATQQQQQKRTKNQMNYLACNNGQRSFFSYSFSFA